MVTVKKLSAIGAVVVSFLAAIVISDMDEHKNSVNETIVDISRENYQPTVVSNITSPPTTSDNPLTSQISAREFTTDINSRRDTDITTKVYEHDINVPIAEDTPDLFTSFRQLEAALFAQEKSELKASVEEDTLRKTFIREAFAGVSLVTADCRVTLCRMEVMFSNQDGMQRFFDEFANAVGWNSQGVINFLPPDSSGNSRIVYILSKDGETLPSL